MTQRERKEAKIEKRMEWAESRDRKANAAFEGVRKIADNIPLGQPILVGHHSQKRAVRDQERMQSGMSRGVESANMADHHREVADGIEHQLDTTIFSDDPDAIDALTAKAARIEAERDRCKMINSAYRKLDGDITERLTTLVKSGVMTDSEAMAVGRMFSLCPYEKQPYPSYHLTNLGATARNARERITIVNSRNQHIKAAQDSAGGVLIECGERQNVCRVTFAEKPDRDVLTALRNAGYRWTGASWYGALDKLPESISE